MAALKLRINHWGEVALDRRALRAVMAAAARDVARKDRALISSNAGSGRLYYGGGGAAYRGSYRPGRYRASAPGSPPVRVTGTLGTSIKTYTYKDGTGFAVRERAFYSLFLEAGARGGGNPGSRAARSARRRSRRYGNRIMAPRPHLDRVMQQAQAELDRRVRKALSEGLTWRETK
jgi:hypothetical protein